MPDKEQTLLSKVMSNMMANYVLHGDEFSREGVSMSSILSEHFERITPQILKEPLQYEVQLMSPIPYTPDDVQQQDEVDQLHPVSGFTPSIPWPDPTPEQLQTLWFNRIWDAIKTWDINVPEAYEGYCSANGNHVVHILNAITADHKKYFDEHEQWK